MVAFLRWLRTIGLGALNTAAVAAVFVAALLLVLSTISYLRGDGMPDKILLTLDLRSPFKDSAQASPLELGAHPPTVMDIVLALDQAGRDPRVKGLFVRLGGADLPVPRAEEIAAALKRFRATGKFVIAHAQDFDSTGLGDYLAATGAGQIWMQPEGVFSASGPAASAIFLRGLFDKIGAVPEIVKRSDFKSAADMFMEKDYTAPDRLQTTALLQSWYDSATSAAAAARGIDLKAFDADLGLSPQFAEAALREKLVDRLGYDDDARDAAQKLSGDGVQAVSLSKYWKATRDLNEFGGKAEVALIEASGDIVEGSTGHGGLLGSDDVIAGDDLSSAIRSATADKSIKAILLRIDSPGGSVTASAQILDALRKARAAGKAVVVSMGTLAASGGYYVSCDANEIVAEPGTLTGSIGVLTGKVAIGKSLAMIGVGADQIGVGKNALFDSSITPYTADQLAELNAQADAIYADFMQKVAAGRKLSLAQVQDIAKGRVWTGADAKARGLVDHLGGFWTAVAEVKRLTGMTPGERVVFKRFPARLNFLTALNDAFGGTAAGMQVLEGLARLDEAPAIQAVTRALATAPHGVVEMRAVGLPETD